jgi:hypothetical protein
MAVDYEWKCDGWLDGGRCPVDKPCEVTSEDDPGECLHFPKYAEAWHIKGDNE